jgi:hypothetical protein
MEVMEVRIIIIVKLLLLGDYEGSQPGLGGGDYPTNDASKE